MTETEIGPAATTAAGPPPADDPTVVLQYRAVSKIFKNGVRAAQDVSFDVHRGEFLAIVGPSGCGKSTLLNMAAGIMRISAGEVLHDGKPVTGPNTKVGYITQKDLLLPWRTVERNVAFPLEARRMAKDERTARVAHVLRQVGLEGFEHSYPNQLSGGMRKRASIARVLAYQPDVYFMDEPFASLDAQLRMAMHNDLLRLRQETAATIVFVTHDLVEAITLADRVLVMTPRPARIRAEFPIDIPTPRDVVSVQGHPLFHRHFTEIWDALHDRSEDPS